MLKSTGVRLSGLRKITSVDTSLLLARDFIQQPEYQEVKDQPEACTTLNLIYHVCPYADSDVWRSNVEEIVRRWPIFNGKKVIAISTGKDMASVETVKKAFGHTDCEFLEVPNSRSKRENASFALLMDRVRSTAPNEATFYAHAKGVTTIGDAAGVQYWRNGMYHTLLDQPAVKLLNTFPFVGTHRTPAQATFPDGITKSCWHFAGTYWWFRNRDVFGRKDWREMIPPGGWGVEAYPAILYPDPAQVACVWMDNAVRPYDVDTYKLKIVDHRISKSSTAIKLELGGGRSPRKMGYVNIDKLDDPHVDVQFDFDDLTWKKLPYADEAVLAVSSSHCFEHLKSDTLKAVLWEICRVMPVGGVFELTMPHWNHNAAMLDTHLRTIGEDQVRHWSDTAIDYWWKGSPRRLLHHTTNRHASEYLAEARPLFPLMNDQQIMRFIPDTCHEIVFHFTVIGNA